MMLLFAAYLQLEGPRTLHYRHYYYDPGVCGCTCVEPKQDRLHLLDFRELHLQLRIRWDTHHQAVTQH